MFTSCANGFQCASVLRAAKHPCFRLCVHHHWIFKIVISKMGYLFVQALLSAFLCGIYGTFYEYENKPTALSISTLNLIFPRLWIFDYMIMYCSACFRLASWNKCTCSSHWLRYDRLLFQSVSILTLEPFFSFLFFSFFSFFFSHVFYLFCFAAGGL